MKKPPVCCHFPQEISGQVADNIAALKQSLQGTKLNVDSVVTL